MLPTGLREALLDDIWRQKFCKNQRKYTSKGGNLLYFLVYDAININLNSNLIISAPLNVSMIIFCCWIGMGETRTFSACCNLFSKVCTNKLSLNNLIKWFASFKLSYELNVCYIFCSGSRKIFLIENFLVKYGVHMA